LSSLFFSSLSSLQSSQYSSLSSYN
jgi:hypothetical protein